jgi:hypothetical protein
VPLERIIKKTNPGKKDIIRHTVISVKLDKIRAQLETHKKLLLHFAVPCSMSETHFLSK